MKRFLVVFIFVLLFPLCAVSDVLRGSGTYYDLPIAAWLFDEETGTTAYEYYGTSALNFLLSGADLTSDGIDFSTSGSDYAYISASNNNSIEVTTPFSFAFRVTFGSSSTASQHVVHITDHASNYYGWGFMTDGSGALQFYYGDGTGGYGSDRRLFELSTTPATSTSYDVACAVTDTSGSASGVSCWVDGSSESITTYGTGGAMAYNGSGETHMGKYDKLSQNSDVIVRYLYIYDHAIIEAEADAIDADYIVGVKGIPN